MEDVEGKDKDETYKVMVKVKFSVWLIKFPALKTLRVAETPSPCIYSLFVPSD